ncbi:MAG TPA: hypothetical protein VM889_05250 [Candidatus Thermoplasmatota archaeon]|nr:hypothetical protein [Candidatus Thermoplasmatota archaeon]
MDGPEAARRLIDSQSALGDRAVAWLALRRPFPDGAAGERVRAFCLEDTLLHVETLAAAVEFGEPGLFARYARWCREVLAARGIAAEDLALNLEALGHAHAEIEENEEARRLASEALEAARRELEA